MSMRDDQAERIVSAVLDELEGRGGMDMLNIIHDDTETYSEMYWTLKERVIAAFDSHKEPTKDRWHPEREK